MSEVKFNNGEEAGEIFTSLTELSFKENGKFTFTLKSSGLIALSWLNGIGDNCTYKVEKNFLILFEKNGKEYKRMEILSLSKKKMELEYKLGIIPVKYKFVKK